MIRVERTAKPDVLVKKQGAWTASLLDAATDAARKRAENKYRHKDIKAALVAMFHGKCAYCESKITHIDYGHIEHFRPKSHPRFRSLTFEWGNLLLSCARCNGAEQKGAHFPGAAEGGPLVNPCEDEPQEHFDFVFDPRARLASVVGRTPRGKTTEKLLGLNRPELRAHRSYLVDILRALSLLAKSDPDARRLILEACRDNAEYAAFARALVAALDLELPQA